MISLTSCFPLNRTSIRVLHNGRRWWYQPNCIVSEKSGLTDSPVVWFLKRMLRLHGYQPANLQLVAGNALTNTSWELGDLVVPKKMLKGDKGRRFGVDDAVGRIVSEASTSGTQSSANRNRGTGSVTVEFVSPSFAEGASIQIGSSNACKSPESRRVPVSRLVHTSVFHGVDAAQQPRTGSLSAKLKKAKQGDAKDMEVDEDSVSGNTDEYSLDSGVLSDLQGIKYLDPSAINRIIKECEKTSSSLNALFEAGLPTITLQALDCVQKNMRLAGSDESLAHALSSLGNIAILVARKSFPEECHHEEAKKDCSLDNARIVESAPPPEGRRLNNAGDGAEEEGNHRSSGSSRSQSLQERRRMLLSLMSRARRGDVGSLGELLARDISGVPSIDISADTAALFFGAPSDIGFSGTSSEGRDTSRMENARPNESRGQLEESEDDVLAPTEKTLLEEVLRGRDGVSWRSDYAGNSTIPLSVVKDIVSMGIAGNSLPWLKSLLYSAEKKVPRKQTSREAALLKEATDEDGMALLELAVSLGCSVEVVRCLIRFGCPVEESAIKQAADLDLPDVLAVLLRYRVYSDGMLDLGRCSATVATVVEEAKTRQEAELRKLRQEADNFLVAFFRQLVELCFSRRWQHQDGSDLFSRSVVDTLVGNIELCALRQRKDGDSSVVAHPTAERDDASPEINAYGLLQILPTSILGKALSADSTHLTTLFLLTEDFLCSKGVNDGGAGLIVLLTLLQRFPSLYQSQDMERYGFAELVASHDALASNKIADISTNVFKRVPECIDSSQTDLMAWTGMLQCPKKHPASLHVTKHASFRCDLCGKGVEKGSIMHGCRQCDWDACEICTDSAEGGLVKWTFVREMASQCQDLLCQDDASTSDCMKEENEWSERMVEVLKAMNNDSEVNTLSIRLLQRDPASIRTLATMLSTRGQITIHQFLMVILPALHSSLLGKTSSDSRSKGNRRTKKPRVAGNAVIQRDIEDGVHENEEERLKFAREVLNHLVRCSKAGASLSEERDVRGEPASLEFRRFDDDDEFDNSDDDDDDDDEDEDLNDQRNKLVAGYGKGKSQHLPGLIRRLHQVLALHEDVISFTVKNSGRKDSVSPDELRSLKSPIKIHLSGQSKGPKTTIIAEPLATVEDLSQQLLKTALRFDPQYSAFCQKLADDSAIIIERTRSSSAHKNPWRVAKILSYDSRGGWHSVNYAKSIKGGVHDAKLHLECESDFSRLKYDPSVSNRLMLASREYVVIHRRPSSSELKSAFDMEHFLAEGMMSQEGDVEKEDDVSEIGSQVESDFAAPKWRSYTVLSRDSSRNNTLYDLVSDDGEVICGVPTDRIRGLPGKTGSAIDLESDSPSTRAERRSAEARQHLSRAFPFLSTRRLSGTDDPNSSGSNDSSKSAKTILRRTWSALGPLESMRPVEITAKSTMKHVPDPSLLTWKCDFGDQLIQVFVESDSVDLPPSVVVDFGSSSKTTSLTISATRDTTLVSLLCQLHEGQEVDIFNKKGHEIEYGISIRPSRSSQRLNCLKKSALKDMHSTAGLLQTQAIDVDDIVSPIVVHPTRSRKLSDSAVSDEEDAEVPMPSEGLDEICIQCLEIIEFMAEVDKQYSVDKKSEEKNSDVFVNQRLSQKLTDQLQNPLIVVGGAVPTWCLELPSFSPHAFTYASRKMLLERVAFGVSRSTLRQQEAKVNVGRLRQRMTALRARAVELVGEAFSGGAEDPTALQLQADELYGMEEVRNAIWPVWNKGFMYSPLTHIFSPGAWCTYPILVPCRRMARTVH